MDDLQKAVEQVKAVMGVFNFTPSELITAIRNSYVNEADEEIRILDERKKVLLATKHKLLA